jgi:diguanylate cyclase (GGDEF)-like protein
MRGVHALLPIALLATSLPAQRYHFRNYGQAEGLSNLSVTCLTQDRQGFLWVGTQDGIFRYDGKRFQRIAAPDGLLDTWISAVLQAPGGDLYAASDRGVARWDGRNFQTVTLVDARSLAWDPAGKLLVGTVSGPMENVYVDGHGKVWYTRGSHAFVRLGAAVEAIMGVPAEPWAAILSDPGGNLWLRSDSAIYLRESGQAAFRRLPGNYPSADGRGATLVLNEKNQILAPTARGLAILDARGGLVRLLDRRTAGLLSSSVSAFLRDREGSAWVGYAGSGVGIWEGYGQWEFWNSDDGLASDSVWAVRKDGPAYWFATDAGVTRMAGGRFDSWLQDSRILSFDLDRDGSVWAASPDGLRRLNPATGVVKYYGPADGLVRDFMGAVAVEKSAVWVGTNHGLYVGGGDAPFRLAGEPDLSIAHLLFRRNGDLVACTSKGLLIRSTAGVWKRFTTADGLRANDILTATESPDGAIWIGYGPDAGLTRCTLRAGRLEVQHFGWETFRSITFLGSDEAGRIWVGSEAGVDALQEGRWFHYRRGDGLVWNDICRNAFFADPDGSVWIGTAQGVSRFHPTAHTASRKTNGALVQQIRVGERRLAPDVVNRLPYRDRTLTIDFTALIFKNEEAVRFRYRLRGLEEAWTETAKRSARYTNLPSGEYVFEVESRGENDTWDLEPARTTFRIETPWYQSWYFFAAFAGSSLCGVRWFWRWRLAAMLARKREVETAVKERTEALHELAIRDALTGLHNRGAIFHLLERQLEDAHRTGHPLTVIMADLDRFKSVNDRFGHQVGDGVLMECAARLRATVRASDLIGRYGGEELLIVLLNCGPKDAARIAEGMRHAICATPFTVLDRTFPVSCSFGLASAGGERVEIHQLVQRADRALYQAKRAGRNRVEAWDGVVSRGVV